MKSIIGLKKEMTRIFTEDGSAVACTIVDVSDVKVVGKKTKERDGYDAIILGIGQKRKPTKSEKGKFANLKYVPNLTFEFRRGLDVDLKNLKVGETVKPDQFEVGEKVDVRGITKGKGFQGVMKRWGFHGGPRTHGQSDRERAGGSIGAGTDPGRVFKGKKMPGHMGNRKKTIQNLKIVKVDSKNSLLCIKGAIPGGRNTVLKIYKSR
jgi:large subunit ribosomal protein L3